MLDHTKIGTLIAATAYVFASTAAAHAQSSTRAAQTDPRWYAWLGCWAANASETGEQGTSSSTTCVVPIAGSAAVEALTIARNKIVARDRLDASRPHALDGQGCHGMEAVNWSQTGRRAFVRADYTCSSGVRGTSTTLFSISPAGEWLRVEEVRSGNGSTVSVGHLHDVGILALVSTDAARAIDDKRREITAARAAAAAAITAEEITDATYALNGSVVRAWLFATSQRFDVDPRELATLARADLPLSVLQTLAALAGYQGAPLYSARRDDGNVYMNSSSVNVAPQLAEASPYDGTGYPCSPLNCYGYNPYSTFNGFGFPFGFPLTFVTHSGTNQQHFRGQSSHGGGNTRPRGGNPGRPGGAGNPGRPVGGIGRFTGGGGSGGGRSGGGRP
jgi:hypothetical protein